MRVIFAGTPEVALPTLEALWKSSHELVGVITREPARQGRSKRLIESPVALWAQTHKVELLETNRPSQPSSLQWIKDKEADLGVVVAYGAILKTDVLEAPKGGWVNLHFSALPRYRGAAPVQHAILNQEATIGTSVFQLDEGMDTGPVFSIQIHELPATWTSGIALQELAVRGGAQVVTTLDKLAAGELQPTPQDPAPASLAPKLDREDGFIDFRAPSAELAARIRAVTPTPGAWTLGPSGTLLKLRPVEQVAKDATLKPGQIMAGKNHVRVGSADGAVELSEVAPAGKNWMDAAAWARGARLEQNSTLGGDVLG